jgi:hypothetical protein
MSRTFHLALLWLSLLGASEPPRTAMPDAVEAGRVAAGLSDWQTITYFLIVLLAISTVERLIAGWQSRSTAAKLAEAIDGLAEATQSRATDIKVTLALIQQAEGDLKGLLTNVGANQAAIIGRLDRLAEELKDSTVRT